MIFDTFCYRLSGKCSYLAGVMLSNTWPKKTTRGLNIFRSFMVLISIQKMEQTIEE